MWDVVLEAQLNERTDLFLHLTVDNNQELDNNN